jgi:Protein of unknown function (DUF4242)
MDIKSVKLVAIKSKVRIQYKKWKPETTKKNGAIPKSQMSRKLKNNIMPKYVIEREIPGAGKLTAEQLKAISQTSCGVLNKMGPEIQWVNSHVTDNKIYCVYIAPNEEMVREHAKQGGFPANSIHQVSAIIDPTTAE